MPSIHLIETPEIYCITLSSFFFTKLFSWDSWTAIPYSGVFWRLLHNVRTVIGDWERNVKRLDQCQSLPLSNVTDMNSLLNIFKTKQQNGNGNTGFSRRRRFSLPNGEGAERLERENIIRSCIVEETEPETPVDPYVIMWYILKSWIILNFSKSLIAKATIFSTQSKGHFSQISAFLRKKMSQIFNLIEKNVESISYFAI